MRAGQSCACFQPQNLEVPADWQVMAAAAELERVVLPQKVQAELEVAVEQVAVWLAVDFHMKETPLQELELLQLVSKVAGLEEPQIYLVQLVMKEVAVQAVAADFHMKVWLQKALELQALQFLMAPELAAETAVPPAQPVELAMRVAAVQELELLRDTAAVCGG